MSTQEAPQTPRTVDKTPEGHAQQAALPSGEVMQEFGIVDLDHSFPSQRHEWQDEFPMDAPTEQHVVVPFRVVKRGIRSLRSAKQLADHYEDERGGSFKAVLLSDMRGM